MTTEPDRCPHCHEELEIEQRGIHFYCFGCGADIEASPETMIELLPVKEGRAMEGLRDKGMLPWLVAGGLTIWLLLAFSVFEGVIGFQEWRYRRGLEGRCQKN